MTLNPKKLRPYDEPPRRRRRLIPESPGSAATGFLVVAALWLAAATGLGVLAVGLRVLPDFSFSFPLYVFDLSFEFDARRVDAAFVNALVYGWLSNAGLAAVCFITPRLVGRAMTGEAGLNLAMVVWNVSVAGGVAGLYVFDTGAHTALTAFPWLIDGGMALALLIVTAAFLSTAGSALIGAYVSAWYLAVALVGYLGLTAANAALSFFTLSDVTVVLASGFVGRAIETVWLLGTALAALHFVIPLASGNTIHSAGAGVLGWLTWLVLAPVSGLALLIDTSVPFAITTVGSAATILLLVPVALVVTNLFLTLRGRLSLLLSPSSVAFATVGLAFLLAAALLQAIGTLRTVWDAVGRTEWTNGVFAFAALGAFTFAALALGEHALPRLLRRTWGGGLWSGIILWTAFGGATVAGLTLMGAGLAEGSLLGQAAAPQDVHNALVPYRAAATLGLGLSALGGLAVLVNLFLMYTSGGPVSHPVSDEPTGGAQAGQAPAAAGT